MKMMLSRNYVLGAALLGISLPAVSAHADSITYNGHSGNAYEYGIDITSSGLEFFPGATIVFTGLSGVTGASDELPGDFAATFTSTSATFTYTLALTVDFPGPAIDNNFFQIDSAAPLGTITYTAVTREGILSGPLSGPVAVSPEPGSLALLATGLLAAGGFMRRRLA